MKTAKLVRPLTKRRPDGSLYTRRQVIQAGIAIALEEDLATLVQRALISNRKHQDYLHSECLVYLVREAMRSDDEKTLNALCPILFARCKSTVSANVSEELGEQVLSKFVDLLARDRVDKESVAVDYFEVSFYHAFLMRGKDAARAQTKRRDVFLPLLDESDDHTEADIQLRKSTEDALVAAHLEGGDPVLRNELREAVANLPEEERQAVVLVYFFGYEEESEKPSKVTAATLAGVSGRTIRNRLVKAFKKIEATTLKE